MKTFACMIRTINVVFYVLFHYSFEVNLNQFPSQFQTQIVFQLKVPNHYDLKSLKKKAFSHHTKISLETVFGQLDATYFFPTFRQTPLLLPMHQRLDVLSGFPAG